MWEEPRIETINMSAEIGGYQSDDDDGYVPPDLLPRRAVPGPVETDPARAGAEGGA